MSPFLILICIRPSRNVQLKTWLRPFIHFEFQHVYQQRSKYRFALSDKAKKTGSCVKQL